jgi:hypothetical protein
MSLMLHAAFETDGDTNVLDRCQEKRDRSIYARYTSEACPGESAAMTVFGEDRKDDKELKVCHHFGSRHAVSAHQLLA